jgi:flagellar assembly protein FliH
MNSKRLTSSEDESDPSPGNRGAQTVSAPGIAPFVYRPAPGWTPAQQAGAAAIAAAGPAVASVTQLTGAPAPPAATPDGYDRGLREGIAKARAESEALIAQQRAAVAAALTEFSRERQSYFLRVEGEVVSLALAIVRKILHRESQVDPLMLTGLVRVALDKMTASQNVRLFVRPSELRLWQDYFFGRSDLGLVPELMADESLEQHHVRIETDHGVTDLHLEAQLKEIEQGLFDLLAQRPVPK